MIFRRKKPHVSALVQTSPLPKQHRPAPVNRGRRKSPVSCDSETQTSSDSATVTSLDGASNCSSSVTHPVVEHIYHVQHRHDCDGSCVRLRRPLFLHAQSSSNAIKTLSVPDRNCSSPCFFCNQDSSTDKFEGDETDRKKTSTSGQHKSPLSLCKSKSKPLSSTKGGGAKRCVCPQRVIVYTQLPPVNGLWQTHLSNCALRPIK